MAIIKKLLIIILLVVFSSYAFADTANDLNTNIIFYTPFDSDAVDDVGLKSATIDGAVSTVGIINNAYYFDGLNDIIYYDDSNDFNFGNGLVDSSFSVTAWINMTDATFFTIADKSNQWIFFTQSDDTLAFCLIDDSSGNRICRKTSGLTSNENKWLFVVATYDGSGIESGINIYINTTDSDSGSVSAGSYIAMNDETSTLNVGKRTTFSSIFSNGIIDELGIFSSEITQEQIDFLYNLGSPTTNEQYPFSSGISNFTININSPSNNTYSQNPIITINYTIIDATNTEIDCTVYDSQGNKYLRENEIVNISIIRQFNVETLMGGNGVFSYYMNCTNGTMEKLTGTYNYIYDTTAPELSLTLNPIAAGFSPATWASLDCNDDLSPTLNYNLTVNSVTLNASTNLNLTIINKSFDIINGVNTGYGYCKDLAGNSISDIELLIGYVRTIWIVDEKTGAAFDVSNVSELMVFFEDFNNTYDIKGSGQTNVTLVSNSTDPFRVDIEYADGTIITRYINLGLIEENAKICANKDTVEHQTQYMTSGTEKPAILKSLYANCYVAAGYTRLAYQDFLMLPAYTIDRLYYLYTFDDGQPVYLSSVDGSIGTDINLASLEFSKTAYNFNVLLSQISFKDLDNDTIKIYYRNPRDDSIKTDISISRMDSGQILFSTTETTNPNELLIYFDYSTLTGVNESTVFKIVATKTTATGATETQSQYFNLNLEHGVLPNGIAVTLAILLTMFGLTLGVAKLTFSWFGAIIQVGSIVLLSLALSTWVTNLITFINVIILVYIFIILYTENYPQVA